MSAAPPPSLSLRTSPRGGEVLARAEPNPPHVLGRSWALVLLIHGYNNDMPEGTQAYEGFRARQRELGEPVADRPLVDVYWPGDASWWIFSPLYYPWSIGRARESAPVLARAIEEAVALGGWKQIDVVAHSLGCRLALELIAALAAVPGVYVRRVALMAAAVPTFMLEPGHARRLREAWDAMRSEGPLSLYSPADPVLALAFPLGQTAGGAGEGWFPTALGHDCWAGGLTPPGLAQREIPGARHSDYWGWKEDTLAQSREAARHVREFLQLGPVAVRELAVRSAPARAGAEARAPAAPREVPAREVEPPQTA